MTIVPIGILRQLGSDEAERVVFGALAEVTAWAAEALGPDHSCSEDLHEASVMFSPSGPEQARSGRTKLHLVT